ncbi:MAG: asparaginase domain-containing protein [Bacteroidetes bacterium]|nr:asparaginase domain-containing protein [Bacteroidota bacterium]
MSIQVFITGGTFDKEYNELNGSLYFKETHLHEMLELGRSKLDLAITTLMMKDSLDFTDNDRQQIAEACLKTSADKIFITHGTDTMTVTASYLAKHCKNKTIVLTGAMVPYKFGSSDGLFNLGSALAFVQVLPKGVFIAMNGKIFEADKVQKNKDKGEFEAL